MAKKRTPAYPCPKCSKSIHPRCATCPKCGAILRGKPAIASKSITRKRSKLRTKASLAKRAYIAQTFSTGMADATLTWGGDNSAPYRFTINEISAVRSFMRKIEPARAIAIIGALSAQG